MKVYPIISLTKATIVGIGVFVFIGFFAILALSADRFVDNGDGTVTDTKIGLMWAVKDNGNHISWPNALSYCQNYNGGGYTDWLEVSNNVIKNNLFYIVGSTGNYFINIKQLCVKGDVDLFLTIDRFFFIKV